MANSNSPNKWRERFLRYAPLVLWIALIFLLSSALGSMSHTSRIIRPVLEWLFPAASPETITLYHAYVRKFAHFTEYAILAFWAWRAFKTGKRARVSKGVKENAFERFLEKNWFLSSFGLVVLIASIDEISQRFNLTRTGSIYDVLLDISGGFAMILILAIYEFIKRNRRPEKF